MNNVSLILRVFEEYPFKLHTWSQISLYDMIHFCSYSQTFIADDIKKIIIYEQI